MNYDPSNAIIAGDDPLVLLEAVKHRVLTMHASDRYWEGGSLEDLWTLDIDARRGYAPILKHGVVGRGLNSRVAPAAPEATLAPGIDSSRTTNVRRAPYACGGD